MTEFDATKIAKHRLAILSKWGIPKGSKVLELGCGQGDCTAVLAELVGPNGYVTAVDPGSLDYGWFLIRSTKRVSIMRYDH